MGDSSHTPRMDAARVRQIEDWHRSTSDSLHALGAHDVEYLGLRIHVPETVFPPSPVSHLLGRAVLDEVRPGDRVLDMGTGTGVNAILAARTAADVTAVDVNPNAVAAAIANAAANGVAERVTVREGSLFDGLDGVYDLIVFDPPFRWFAPRDLLEVAFTDENYETLTAFFDQLRDRLAIGGRALVFFGTSGDMAYLLELIDRNELHAVVLDSLELEKDGTSVIYSSMRISA